MNALLYQPNNKWRFVTALTAAAAIHIAAISLATTQRKAPPIAAGFPGETELVFDPAEPTPDPQPEQSDPMPSPPTIDEFYAENTATPPPVRRQPTKFIPVARSRNSTAPGSLNISAAKILALNAPRPEYPFEARRQKITGDGIAVLTIDPASGSVIQVTMSKSTGNSFLDNAAKSGFRRWRFKPGTASSVVCPVTFALTGASY
jgi:TonB family protein